MFFLKRKKNAYTSIASNKLQTLFSETKGICPQEDNSFRKGKSWSGFLVYFSGKKARMVLSLLVFSKLFLCSKYLIYWSWKGKGWVGNKWLTIFQRSGYYFYYGGLFSMNPDHFPFKKHSTFDTSRQKKNRVHKSHWKKFKHLFSKQNESVPKNGNCDQDFYSDFVAKNSKNDIVTVTFLKLFF